LSHQWRGYETFLEIIRWVENGKIDQIAGDILDLCDIRQFRKSLLFKAEEPQK